MAIRIVTDSTCDLPKEVIEAFGVTIVPLFINIDEQGCCQDGVDITREDFYKNLPNYTVHPTTGTPGIDAFTQAYQTLASAGADEILSIHISKSLSATVDVARTAASQFEQIPVTVRDSHQLSLGTGFQVELAAQLANEGKSMAEIQAALDDLMPRTFVAARLVTLEYLRRSGRMNRFMTGIGSLLQFKPILTMKEGNPKSERVRTDQKAEARLIEMLEERQPFERFALVHTHAAEQAEAFRARVAGMLPETEFYSMDITPVIGAHLGPGAVGFAIVTK